ncbi:MAG: hypothetical protein AMS27_15700 [Bacteroides sp. SM23_62_1]|nr:MAG: hypothetical protein AMS27_15700 [Bacteroides sp. SM23_62_1]
MNKSITAAVIVAHPDDETLWAGGTVLAHPLWDWYIITLCRKSDPDRAPKFYRVLEILGAEGIYGIKKKSLSVNSGPLLMKMGGKPISQDP